MNINYVFIGVGVVSFVAGLFARFDWGLLLTGASLALSGWSQRNVQSSPWVKHPTIRDTSGASRAFPPGR
jgi:hypothetical protein